MMCKSKCRAKSLIQINIIYEPVVPTASSSRHTASGLDCHANKLARNDEKNTQNCNKFNTDNIRRHCVGRVNQKFHADM